MAKRAVVLMIFCESCDPSLGKKCVPLDDSPHQRSLTNDADGGLRTVHSTRFIVTCRKHLSWPSTRGGRLVEGDTSLQTEEELLWITAKPSRKGIHRLNRPAKCHQVIEQVVFAVVLFIYLLLYIKFKSFTLEIFRVCSMCWYPELLQWLAFSCIITNYWFEENCIKIILCSGPTLFFFQSPAVNSWCHHAHCNLGS